MVTFKDIILEISLGVLWFVSTLILVINGNTILPFFTICLFIYLKIQLKRRKKILPYVKDDFKKLGFEITNERASKLSEMKYEISFFQITVGGTPIYR